MKIFTLFALLVAIVAVIFASQNSMPVFVRFLGWQTQQSMALVLMLTFTLGVAFGFLVSLPPMIRRMRRISHLKHQVNTQASDLDNVSQKLAEVKKQLTVLQTPPVSESDSDPPFPAPHPDSYP